MTVPAPRGAQTGGGQDNDLIVGTLRRLEDTVATGFRDLHGSIEKLRDETVHRREFDRYRDERALEWVEARRQHDKDVAEMRETADRERTVREERERQEARDREAQERQDEKDARERAAQEKRDRRVEWRWRLGLLAGAATAFGTALLNHPTH